MTGPKACLRAMFKSFEFCVPTKASIIPNGPDWLHEVKYDGSRVERDGNRVRLITRGGYNWTDRYPWITEAARKKPAEAVCDRSRLARHVRYPAGGRRDRAALTLEVRIQRRITPGCVPHRGAK
jgi:hypothetical protein